MVAVTNTQLALNAYFFFIKMEQVKKILQELTILINHGTKSVTENKTGIYA